MFAEITTTTEIIKADQDTEKDMNNQNPMEAKLKILEDELKIIEQSNSKFKEENEDLKTQINDLNNLISNFQAEISNQKQLINQFNIDTKELEFLRLNLEYGHKCRKSFLNNKGFTVSSSGYKNCVLNKGRLND